MITVKHFLKDGTETESVKGHVIKPDECPDYYRQLERIARKENDGCRNDTERSERVA